MEVVEFLWCDDATHESATLEVLSLAQAHGNDISLPISWVEYFLSSLQRATHASLSTTSWVIRFPFSSHFTASG